MGRAARAEDRGGGGGAARIAARRRDAAKVAKPALKAGAKRTGAAPKKAARGNTGGGAFAKVAKLGLMVLAMLCIGFFAVLVVDVGAKLVGKVHLGDVTVVDLWHKVVDRALDRDVPVQHADAPAATPVRAPRISHVAPVAPAARAPLPAARPEDDARHVEREPAKGGDPQAERARQRLDEILGRL